MTDDEASPGNTRKREQTNMTLKDNAILFVLVVVAFIIFTIVDLQLSKLALDSIHVSVGYTSNLIVLVIIIVETFVVYRTIKWALIEKKKAVISPGAFKPEGKAVQD